MQKDCCFNKSTVLFIISTLYLLLFRFRCINISAGHKLFERVFSLSCGDNRIKHLREFPFKRAPVKQTEKLIEDVLSSKEKAERSKRKIRKSWTRI